jgi:hypothetical protein
LAQETGVMPDTAGVVETTFFSHNPLRALSCVFRLVYFGYTHVLSFSHLNHIRTLTQEKSYESTIHSLGLAIQLLLEKATIRAGKEENDSTKKVRSKDAAYKPLQPPKTLLQHPLKNYYQNVTSGTTK